jgi:pimeloyl-ACP methyl ester carboxylesterase
MWPPTTLTAALMWVMAHRTVASGRASVPAMTVSEFDVPVSGGHLRVCRWGANGPAVVGIHGITANALSLAYVGQALEDVGFIAPDLRGRAQSAALPGPYGLGAHVDDLIATLDHSGVERAVLMGHSMGGFVAALTAARYPDRVRSVLLVDGGVAFGVPVDEDIDVVLERVIGPAMRRLSMRFGRREEYADWFRAHPALAEAWTPEVEAYALRDLAGDRSSCVLEAIREDAKDTLVHEETTTAYRKVTVPISLLTAERGMLDEPTGLYGHSAVEGIEHEMVPDVNHYTIVAAPRGAATVAGRIRRLLALPR